MEFKSEPGLFIYKVKSMVVEDKEKSETIHIVAYTIEEAFQLAIEWYIQGEVYILSIKEMEMITILQTGR